MATTLHLEDVSIGMKLPELVVRPTAVTLFRFSAVTWNPHRIHYDAAYAATEGYPDVLVHSHLHGCWLFECVRAWAGPDVRLTSFSWQNRRYAVPGDVLTVSGEVTGIDDGLATCDLREVNQDGETCAPGRAVVRLPRRQGEPR